MASAFPVYGAQDTVKLAVVSCVGVNQIRLGYAPVSLLPFCKQGFLPFFAQAPIWNSSVVQMGRYSVGGPKLFKD